MANVPRAVSPLLPNAPRQKQRQRLYAPVPNNASIVNLTLEEQQDGDRLRNFNRLSGVPKQKDIEYIWATEQSAYAFSVTNAS